MEIPGSSSNITTLQESILSEEDPGHSNSLGQWVIAAMNLPLVALS